MEQGSPASGDGMMSEVGTELGSGGGYEYPAYGDGSQGLSPTLDNNTNGNDSDRNLGGDKQGRNGRNKQSLYDYGKEIELSQVKSFQSIHPKDRDNMLRQHFMARSRFQNYLTDLVNIFKNMH